MKIIAFDPVNQEQWGLESKNISQTNNFSDACCTLQDMFRIRIRIKLGLN